MPAAGVHRGKVILKGHIVPRIIKVIIAIDLRLDRHDVSLLHRSLLLHLAGLFCCLI